MKLYVSADMEGISCVSSREEVTKGEKDYTAAQERMTAEVAAVCEEGFAAGAKEIWVKDSHATGRNIDPAGLKAPAGKTLRLIRGWSGHPFSMVQELDESFHSLLFVGYHSAANRSGNPLAHTLSGKTIAKLMINEQVASEFLVFSYAASTVNVPVTFLSGDEALCESVRRTNETIQTVSTFKGMGNSILAVPPSEALEKIRAGVRKAVEAGNRNPLPLPKHFQVQVSFRDHTEAYRKSFYPGAKLVGDHEVSFETAQYFDVLRLMKFMTL